MAINVNSDIAGTPGLGDTPINVVFPSTQEISISDVSDSIASSQKGLWDVSVNNFPVSYPVTGPLTDAQLRATPVPVSGTVTSTPSGTQNVSIISSIELIVNASGHTVPVSVTSLPLPDGAATASKQDSINVTLGSPFQVGGSIGNTSFAATQSGTWTTARSWSLLNTTDSVNVGNFPATYAVTQSTSPWVISGAVTGPLTDTQLRATPVPISGTITATPTGTQDVNLVSTITVPVSGTFWQTTQPVSIASAPTTPVTGTFWQSTQPVSIASMPTTPVTGTFYQATQPVSIASMPTTAVTGPLTDTQLRATAIPVSGTVTANADVTSTFTFNASNQTFDIDCTGFSTLRIEVTGTWVGSINWLISTDGTTFADWPPINAFSGSAASVDDPLTSNVTALVEVTGVKTYRMTTTEFPWTSGSAAVTVNKSSKASIINAILTQVAVQGDVRIHSSDEAAINIGQQLKAASIPVVLPSDQTVPVSGTFWQATQPVSIASMPSTPVTGTFYQATQPVSIIDGSLATLGAKADAKSTATDTTAISAMSVLKQISASVQAPPSQAVTNAGTFAVQATVAAASTNIAKAEDAASADADVGVPAMAIQKATPADTAGTDGDYAMLQMSAGRLWASAKIDTALPAGSAVIGHVIVDTAPSTAVTNTGTFAVQAAATLAAETTKVIGTVNVAASQTIGISAGAAVIGHVIADSGSTTAVTGNVASTVADGANVTLGAKADAKSTATDTTPVTIMSVLKQISASCQAPPSSAVTNTGTFAVQSAATLSAETTKVIGTVNVAASQTIGLAAGAATIGALTANQSVNIAQVNGSTTVASVTGVQNVTPIKRTGATGLAPNYSASRITSKTTTTTTSATAYISTIVIACSAAGTAWTLVIQDKGGTAKILIPSITLSVPTAGPLIFNFTEPVLMTSGIDIVTAGTTAGTVDVFIDYWQ